jgi:UDP-4-amino-4,6-dideoxy-N-acetyl-beta-L-altrosamine transaminase
MIPYGRQDISQSDIDAVVEVLRSDWLTQGPLVPKFEKTVATHVGAEHAVAVNSATSALHLACLALGLGPGDWLWTSPNTFVASANCALYCGAKADFVDIDPRTYNMSVERLSEKLKSAAHEGLLPKIVVPVHFAGQPCDMPAIFKLSQQYGFKIIEDASHAIGASYNETRVGSCAHSDITVFSFHPVKIITTGEGGMALTNESGLAEKMGRLRTHGITRDASRMINSPKGPWYYEQVELGYNYRMTDLQASLGISQMQRLEAFLQTRGELANRYDALLKSMPACTPYVSQGNSSSWHLYSIRLELKEISRSYREVFETLRTNEIGVNLHYEPVHLQPYYQQLGFRAGQFPEAEAYAKEAISLPLFPGLSYSQQDKVIAGLRLALK